MSILIGCEESQTICGEFRRAGFEAYSCDTEPTRGNPQHHMQCDVFEAVKSRHWGLIILHPPCDFMAVCGNQWYGRYSNEHYKRLAAIEWTLKLWDLAKQYSDRCSLENPVSVIFSHITDQVQYVQPWQFGHGETKKTGFALWNLPPLTPTKIVDGREQKVWKMAPSPTRKRDRSKTYQGIAEAIVSQWGALIVDTTK